MWTPSLRLECDELDPLPLTVSSGWIPQRLDIGFPVVRDVVQNVPDADGTIDSTRYIGNRNVTLEVVLDQTLSGVSLMRMERQLRAFVAPNRRPILYGVFEEGGAEQRMVLRGSNLQSVIDGLDFRGVMLQWVAPSGLIESGSLESATIGPGGEVAQNGLTFNATPDFSFGGIIAPSGGAIVTNSGDVPVWPTITMYGPASNGIVLLNSTTGKSLTFGTTLAIVSGDWVRVDFANKTIVNSTGTTYYSTLDFAASEWWQLEPGENRVYMLPDTFTAPPASALIEWRSAWL